MTERYADPGQRYLLGERIATGGMGEVWRATDTVLGREVAVKLLKAEYADNPEFRARFETEARHAAALHHPGVAAVFDFGDATPDAAFHPYLVMELVDGAPLSMLLRPGRPMQADAARELLVQVAEALGAAHAKGIVHRDVKPANLLVTPDRRIKVTDFGIARAADGMALTQTGQVMGTPQYLSPEQAQGGTATAASDVYSLGVVLFECLSGSRPFQRESPVATALAHLRDPAPPLPDSVPADLRRIVERCLAKEPGARFPDGAALAEALRDPAKAAAAPVPPVAPTAATAVAAAPATAVLPGGLPPARSAADVDVRRRGLSPWWALLPILVLLALIAWALWQGMEQDPDPAGEQPTTTPPTSSTTTSSTTSADPETVFLDPSVCSGDVDDVAQRITDLGLRVQRDEQPNTGQGTAGEVTGCSPTDTLEKDTIVRVSFLGEPPESPSPSTTSASPTDTGSATNGPGNDDKTNGNDRKTG